MERSGKRDTKGVRLCFANPTVLLKRPIAELAGVLLAEGAGISVLAPRKAFRKADPRFTHRLPGGARLLDYLTVQCPFLASEQPFPVSPGFFHQAWRAFKEHDAVHAWVPFYASTTWLALLKLLFFRKRGFFLTMDTVPPFSFSMGRPMDFLLRTYYLTVGRLVFAAADRITLYGESFREYARRAGIPEKKIVITPTGVDLPRRRRTGEENRLRKRLGISPTGKLILFVGLLLERKGVDTLIETATLLQGRGQGSDAAFVLVGDGPGRKRYERLARERGLEDRIVFAGFRTDVQAFYDAADVFFFPSRGEGLPGVVMEAMAHGLPVVASDIPGTRDLIEDGKTGMLCPMEDAGTYADAIGTLLQDAGRAGSLGQAGRQRISEEYSWKRNAARFLALYKNLYAHLNESEKNKGRRRRH